MDNNQITNSTDTLAQAQPYPQMTQAQNDAYMQLMNTPTPAMQEQMQAQMYDQPQVQPQVQPQAQMYGQPQANPYIQNVGSQNPYAQTPYNQNPYTQMPGNSPYNQGVYQQQMQPVVNTAAPKKATPYTPEQTKKAKLLCFLSLGMYVGPYILSLIYGYIVDAFSNLSTDYSTYYSSYGVSYLIFAFFVFALNIAGIILMIVARAKYPKYTFAKVLMWVYIGITVATVLAGIAVSLFVYYLCSNCY